MTFHDRMMAKADTITQLASESVSGIFYLAEHGTPWYSEFAQFTQAEPDAVSHLMDQVDGARNALTRDNTGTLDLISDCVDSWTGAAADNFRVNYLAQLKDAFEMQEDALRALALLAQAHHDVVAKAREDLRRLANQTIGALEAAGDSGGTDLVSIGISVVGAVAVVAGTVASGGTATAPIVWAVVEATAGVASAAYGSAEVGGSNATEILESMMIGLDRIREGIVQEERQIQRGLQEFVEYLSGSYLREICPPAPRIASYPMTPVPTNSDTSWDLTDFELPEAS